MRSTFFNLDDETRERLLEACAREFGTKGYALASTNAIVGEAGIAKGSFFKYFGSKESVYLYLAESVLTDLGELQGPRVSYSSTDIVARAEELFARHMEYAKRRPIRYRFILGALTDSRSPLYGKIAAMRDRISRRTAPCLYHGVDWGLYRLPRREVVEFLACLDLGMRQAAIQELGREADITRFEACVARQFATAKRALSRGIYAKPPKEDVT
jgi:TetR/AcrR family transcriptional regulator